MHYRGYKDLECYIQTRLLMIFISELVFKLINGYISYLEKSKKQTKQQIEPNSQLLIPNSIYTASNFSELTAKLQLL